ncbi:flagellar protein FlgN [Crassaminicella indica]|uniref:Flagellar protein FlgN n=1 Tax=Crassaminicella indica TaxID=2855394 RepID=A0ABX8R7Z8_9CLOT|nr:flagellar protein FlgN [Crassaminicella indica]QXM05164.1 flagellar protein FlgN [Crassaminicella indica]
MSKSIEQLILALSKEYEIYKGYLELAKKKRDVIVEGNIKELEKITNDEQSIVVSMGKIDEIRTAIIGNILFEQKIDWVENITELASSIKDPERTEILSLKDKLGSILKKIKEVNDLNTKLLEQSLEYIEFNVNLLTNAEVKGNTYGSKADENELKHRPNIFDAKV